MPNCLLVFGPVKAVSEHTKMTILSLNGMIGSNWRSRPFRWLASAQRHVRFMFARFRLRVMDQGGKSFFFIGRQIQQRRANRTGGLANHAPAGLDNADGVTAAPVANSDVRKEELLQRLVDEGVIALPHCSKELLRIDRRKIVYSRRVSGHTDRMVRLREDFGCRHAAHI